MAMMFFPFVIPLSILFNTLHVYAYLNDTSSVNLTWSGNNVHPLSANSSQWCYFPATNYTNDTACGGAFLSSDDSNSYQTLIYTHLNLPQGWSIAYYAVDNVTLLGDFTYPVPAEGARMCLSGQALDKGYQTYCDRVLYDNDLGNEGYDGCVVALGQYYVSDGCYTAMPASSTLIPATASATTVTETEPTATSDQSNAVKLQECASGCGKSQCTFNNLSHAATVTYPIIVGTPVENCDPNSNETITSEIGGSVQITDTWSVTTSLGVSFKGLSLSVQGSYSSSKAITYSQTITIQIPPGKRGALVAKVLYNQTSGNMKIGSNKPFPIVSNQPQDVLVYGEQIASCDSQFAATNSSPIACSSSAAVSLRENSLMTFFSLLIPIFALMV